MSRKRKCPTPEKLAFWTREAAETATQSVFWQSRPVVPTRVYWCGGGHYHMTSKP